MLKYVVEELHADIHMGSEDALRQAASHNRDDSVTYLLARDANVHANNDEALRSAVDGGFFDEHQGTIGYGGVVKALLDHGANPFVISEQKLAETEVKYPEIAEMLRAKIAELGGRPAATFRPLTKPHPKYRIGF
jgi:sugar phosphate isomerase/epimerase